MPIQRHARRIVVALIGSQLTLAARLHVRKAGMRTVATRGMATASDVASVLRSGVRFADLPLLPGTQQALANGFGYEYCSPVQAATIPICLEGSDVLVRAKTGTGKTLAFLVPALERLARRREAVRSGYASVIVLCPTREIAAQTASEASRLREHMVPAFNVQCMVGGTPIARETKRFAARGLSEVLVSTPGRLCDHIKNTPGFGKAVGSARTLVLDEADALLDMGFKRDLDLILAALPPKAKRQTMLYTATLTDDVREVARHALRSGEASQTVDCVGAGKDRTADALEQFSATLPPAELAPTMLRVLRRLTKPGSEPECAAEERDARPGKGIVFFPTARLTQLYAQLAADAGLPVLEIHSRKTQKARDKASAAFRAAQSAVLFSSDVSARGVDYPDVRLVLQMGAPSSRAQYVHRTGRSARAGKDGTGLLLLATTEARLLRDLSDLPIEPWTPGSPFYCAPGGPPPAGYAGALRRLAEPDDSADAHGAGSGAGGPGCSTLATMAYQSWLGYYKGVCKPLKWSSDDLVERANEFALHLGLDEPPALKAQVVGKMGLRGVRGLRVLGKAPSSASRAAHSGARPPPPRGGSRIRSGGGGGAGGGGPGKGAYPSRGAQGSARPPRGSSSRGGGGGARRSGGGGGGDGGGGGGGGQGGRGAQASSASARRPPPGRGR